MLDKISVALPVFNGGRYIAAQLDSILQQLEPNDEIVVAYQNSNDDSYEILKSYQDKDNRIILLENTEQGITSNFNLAISHCSGDYIFICDQDDIWLPNKRTIVLQSFKQTQSDLIIHNAVHTDENLVPHEKTFFEIYPIGPGKIRNIVKPRMSGCCMAFNKKLKQILLPLPEIYGYDQWIAVFAEFYGKITYLDDVLLMHRLHGNNITQTKRRKLYIILYCRSKLIINLVCRLARAKIKGDCR